MAGIKGDASGNASTAVAKAACCSGVYPRSGTHARGASKGTVAQAPSEAVTSKGSISRRIEHVLLLRADTALDFKSRLSVCEARPHLPHPGHERQDRRGEQDPGEGLAPEGGEYHRLPFRQSSSRA